MTCIHNVFEILNGDVVSRSLMTIIVLIFFFCWSSSLVAGAYTIKRGEMGCPEFIPRPLNKLCNVPTK